MPGSRENHKSVKLNLRIRSKEGCKRFIKVNIEYLMWAGVCAANMFADFNALFIQCIAHNARSDARLVPTLNDLRQRRMGPINLELVQRGGGWWVVMAPSQGICIHDMEDYNILMVCYLVIYVMPFKSINERYITYIHFT
jgi:hypothetical protein